MQGMEWKELLGEWSGSKGDRPLFTYPESWFVLFLHFRLCKEGTHPFAQNKCSFVFPVPCQWNTFSLKAKGEKTELLKNFEQSFTVLWMKILKEKANLKVHACSKKTFQNSEKKNQENASIMWLVWNELLKWIYLETNESELLLCFLNIKTWRHILGNTYHLGREVLHFVFFLWMESNAQHKYHAYLFYKLKTCKIVYDNPFPYKDRGVVDFL